MFSAPGSCCHHTWSSSCLHRACPVPATSTAVDLGSEWLGRGHLCVWTVAQRAGEEGNIPTEGSSPRVSPSLRLSWALEPQPGTQRGLREQLLGSLLSSSKAPSQGLVLWKRLAPPTLPDPKCCQSSSSWRGLKCAQKIIPGFVETLQKRGHFTRGWSSFCASAPISVTRNRTQGTPGAVPGQV